MERETNERRARETAPDGIEPVDDEEFASIEDVGPEPSETAAVDDV